MGVRDSGVFYCSVHHGIANEDQRVCDFACNDVTLEHLVEPRDCVFHPLRYDPTEVVG